MGFLTVLRDAVWGPLTVSLILAVGVILTVKLRFVQIKYFKKAFCFENAIGKYKVS